MLRAALEPASRESVSVAIATWYAELRTSAKPSPEAELFEARRRDLLRVYYTHPRVHRVLGYSGPPVVRGV